TLVTIAAHQKVGEAIDVMQRYSISQLPVVRDGELSSLADLIGSLQDRDLLDRVFKNPDALHEDVAAAMQPPLAAVDADQTLDHSRTTSNSPACVRISGAGRLVTWPRRLRVSTSSRSRRSNSSSRPACGRYAASASSVVAITSILAATIAAWQPSRSSSCCNE